MKKTCLSQIKKTTIYNRLNPKPYWRSFCFIMSEDFPNLGHIDDVWCHFFQMDREELHHLIFWVSRPFFHQLFIGRCKQFPSLVPQAEIVLKFFGPEKDRIPFSWDEGKHHKKPLLLRGQSMFFNDWHKLTYVFLLSYIVLQTNIINHLRPEGVPLLPAFCIAMERNKRWNIEIKNPEHWDYHSHFLPWIKTYVISRNRKLRCLLFQSAQP